MASVLVLAAAASILLAASVPSSTATVVYSVGDERGWTVPSGNSTETYNHWAKRNRFQVGDVLGFRYGNDSVLLVSHDDYKQCSTANPASRFTDGDTKFTFDRVGLFYFISGVPGHCEVGQRMIVRVMARSVLAAAPAPVKATAAPAPVKATAAPAPVKATAAPAPVKATAAPAPAKAPATAPSVGGASSPVSSAPDTPTYGSSSGSSSSSSPSPMPSGASRRAFAAGFSVVIGLLGVITMVLLA